MKRPGRVRQMLRRYADQKIHLADDQFTKDPSVVNYLLTHSENNKLEETLEDIENMDSVTKFLQRENATLLDARILFDSVISTYPQLDENFGDHAPIIHSKVFETAPVKFQVNKLDVDEVASTKCLQVTAATQDIHAESDNTSDFVESILKKRKLEKTASEDTKDFIDTDFFCRRRTFWNDFSPQRGLRI